jgi:hypothetical protein
VGMDGAPIFDRSDIALVLRQHQPGADLEVSVVRGRELLTLRATV